MIPWMDPADLALEEARRAGMEVHIEPAEHTTAAMVASLRAFYERRVSSKEGQGSVR